MKILFTHRYFWPDSPPYGNMLRNLAATVAENGHEVCVYTALPSYRDRTGLECPRSAMDGQVKIIRGPVFGSERSNIFIRLMNSLAYCIGLFFIIIKTRPDLVTAATFPPVFAAWSASLAARLVKAKFVYHLQDVHPEVSVVSGGALGKGILRKFCLLYTSPSPRDRG